MEQRVANPTILWVDDEIDLLKSHIIFLTNKGYKLETTNSGASAIDIIQAQEIDLVFLDENMPGLSGLETLERIREIKPELPIVFITKSDKESLMEDAIGNKANDFLIKPVHPNQVLLAIKKTLDYNKLVNKKTNLSYQQEFRSLSMDLDNAITWEDWVKLYKKLCKWDVELTNIYDNSMHEILLRQKSEANIQFCKFFENNYVNWIQGKDSSNTPTLSHTLMRDKVFPLLSDDDKPLHLIIIDNLRYDQWLALQTIISQDFRIITNDVYCSIIPTTTQYARNALFAGLMPLDIQNKYPSLWHCDENAKGSRNLNEAELLKMQLKREGLGSITTTYNKISKHAEEKKLVNNYQQLLSGDLNVIICNFIDIMSHYSTDTEIVKELASDTTSYRSLVTSWFENSGLFELLKILKNSDCKIAITTDHGSIQVKKPLKIIGDKTTTLNLRFKEGKHMAFDPNKVFLIENSNNIKIPMHYMSSSFIFAKESDYFIYQNNYNHYSNYYYNTFQHGGISLEEVIIPYIVLKPKI